ncbi:MAG: hypothetical protein MUC62_03390 [Candidatus Thermoplasmatota archaeon]|nr:hypothetical protein [Candidatus Thermoplasmatota archaeon]
MDYEIIGEVAEFRISVSNEYSGSDWIGDEYKSSHDYLFEAKLTILSSSATDQSGNPFPDIFQPTQPDSLKAYNGPNDGGFTISYGRDYYRTEQSDDFSLKVKGSNVNEGIYILPVKLDFRVQVDFSTTDPSGYTWKSVSQSGGLLVQVIGNIGGTEYMLLRGYDSGYVPIYSGAKNLLLRSTSIYPRSSDLNDFKATLNLPTTDYEIEDLVYSKDILSGSTYMTWKVSIASWEQPGTTTGSVIFEYILNDELISEGPYNISLTVAYTPLIKGPDTKGMTEPTITIDQKTTTYNFNLQMFNGGNVPIESAMVRLDIDSAVFIQQANYYFDLNNEATKVFPPLEATVGQVDIDQPFSVSFIGLTLFKMLPPGDYLVPLDYRMEYKGTESMKDSQSIYTSYQWDEYGIEEYNEIMYFRTDPRSISDLEKGLHFMVRVKDDVEGPDLRLRTDGTIETGASSVPVNFELTNRELYPIDFATVEIISTNITSVRSSMSIGGLDRLAYEEEVSIPASTMTTTGSINLQGWLEISSSAPSGLFPILLKVSGYNQVMKLIEINKTMYLMIKARPGCLDVASVQTTSVEPGSDFRMTLVLTNTGDTTIEDYSVMISCLDNMIVVNDPNSVGKDLAPGMTNTVTYDCNANSCLQYGSSCNIKVLTRTRDTLGNSKDFSDGEGIALKINAAREPDSYQVSNGLKDLGIYLMIAFIVSSFLIGTAMVLTVLGYTRLKYPRQKEVKKETSLNVGSPDRSKKQLTAPPPVPPSQPQATTQWQVGPGVENTTIQQSTIETLPPPSNQPTEMSYDDLLKSTNKERNIGIDDLFR